MASQRADVLSPLDAASAALSSVLTIVEVSGGALDQPDPDVLLRRIAELEAESRHLRQAQTISRVGSWYYELGGRALSVSDALLDLYGLDRTIFVGVYAPLDACVHPDDRQPLVAATEQLSSTGEPMSMRYRVLRAADGEQRWFDARGMVDRDAAGTIRGVAGTVADVTELVQAEIDLRLAHTELGHAHSYQQAVITATPDAIHVYDVKSRTISRANRSGQPLIGLTHEMIQVVSGHAVEEYLPIEDLQLLQRTLTAAEALPDGEVLKLRHRVAHDNGQQRWLSRRVTPFARDEDGRVTLVLVISRDVTDVVAVEQQLEHAALHDELTGLPNRRLIRDRLEHSLTRAARGGHIAVLICDLDGFKRINDSHGHHIGDEVLVQASQRLVQATRSADTVARMGGDEFAIVLDIDDHQDAAELAERVATRIAAAIAEPMPAGGFEHRVSISIGIRISADEASAEALLADADAAMYYVKAHGANGHAFFQDSQRPDTYRRGNIERQIRRALVDDAVEAFYQPIVNPVTNALHGVEALLRIRDESGALLNTAQVIEVAEHTGLITALDERMLNLACAQAASWRQRPELSELVLKLNRSVKDITRPGFYRRIRDALADSGLDPNALTLEITETVLLDASAENLADLRALNELGVGLAIDDFGTGYASLRYLAELPITCIKIDRSFTSRLPSDPTSMTLVRATIGLAEQLGINCIVEGVETTTQLGALPEYSRLLIQGFLYARPQPPLLPPAAQILPDGAAGDAHKEPAPHTLIA
ncbi:MAG: sensor-containing diguanylate cyclase/phosphodiesterase [Frankiales bacterium]|nr:sensor-containing diguanylate cyclase/phosphodiesterase [Frankiales bacterium]